jgi:hypothetical protein
MNWGPTAASAQQAVRLLARLERSADGDPLVSWWCLITGWGLTEVKSLVAMRPLWPPPIARRAGERQPLARWIFGRPQVLGFGAPAVRQRCGGRYRPSLRTALARTRP